MYNFFFNFEVLHFAYEVHFNIMSFGIINPTFLYFFGLRNINSKKISKHTRRFSFQIRINSQSQHFKLIFSLCWKDNLKAADKL